MLKNKLSTCEVAFSDRVLQQRLADMSAKQLQEARILPAHASVVCLQLVSECTRLTTVHNIGCWKEATVFSYLREA